MRALVFSIFSIVICSTQALAIGPVRCNGMIQYRPCSEETDLVNHSSIRAQMRRAAYSGRSGHQKSPVVFNSKMFRAGSGVAAWKGRVQGSGQVGLVLVVSNPAGTVIDKRYMGSVNLERDENIWFSFKGPALPDPRYRWVIKAHKLDA